MKSRMSHSETKEFLEHVFNSPFEQARDVVYNLLKAARFTEAHFHDGIEVHGPSMSLTSEQWLRLFQLYKSSVFHSRFDLHRLLSENHFRQLMNELNE